MTTKFELVITTSGNEKTAQLEQALSAVVVEAVKTLGIKTAGAEVTLALVKFEEPQ